MQSLRGDQIGSKSLIMRSLRGDQIGSKSLIMHKFCQRPSSPVNFPSPGHHKDKGTTQSHPQQPPPWCSMQLDPPCGHLTGQEPRLNKKTSGPMRKGSNPKMTQIYPNITNIYKWQFLELLCLKKLEDYQN